MDSRQFKIAAYAAVDQRKIVAQYNDTVHTRCVIPNVKPGYLKALLPDGPPQEGEEWSEIQKDIETKIMPGVTHWQSPNFMAFFPSNTTFPSLIGEMYSAALNAPAFNWMCSPVVTELETIVLDWMAKLWALPACYQSSGEGGGVIQGSASEAIVTVMVAARDRYLRKAVQHISDEKEREDAFFTRRGKIVALGSEMAHSSTQKAAQIVGVRYRSVPVDAKDGFAMQGSKFRQTVDQCLADGLEPFYLTATMGTTATCAIDDFAGIAMVVKNYPSIWIHVDAAYAGAALICPEYQHHTTHFDKFDSFDTNMHKWLLVNFDASCLFVKRRKDLTDALSITASYLRNTATDTGLVTDYRDWQIPLGRRFRSLKIWFVIRSYGVQGMQAHIRNHVKLGDEFAGWIASRPDLFTIATTPAFALTVFHVNPPASNSGEDTTDSRALSNALTKNAYEKINSEGTIMLTSGVAGGVYVIRVVSGSPKTDREHLRGAFEIIVKTAEEVRGT